MKITLLEHLKNAGRFITKASLIAIAIVSAVIIIWAITWIVGNPDSARANTGASLIAAIGSVGAIAVALGLTFKTWKMEVEREENIRFEKTKLVMVHLQFDLLIIYQQWRDLTDAHVALYDKYNELEKSAYRVTASDEFSKFYVSGLILRKTLEHNPLQILGEKSELCFEIDPTVGLALMNLQAIHRAQTPLFTRLFPDNRNDAANMILVGAYCKNRPENETPQFVRTLLISQYDSFDDWYKHRHLVKRGLKKTGVNLDE